MDPRVRSAFKQLVYMAKDYPANRGGYPFAVVRVKEAFRLAQIAGQSDMDRALQRAEYITKGMY